MTKMMMTRTPMMVPMTPRFVHQNLVEPHGLHQEQPNSVTLWRSTWDSVDSDLGGIFVDVSAHDDAGIARVDDLVQKIEQLELALLHRTIISEAVGIVRERYMLDSDSAFRVLCRLSQDTNQKLFEIATEIQSTGWAPGLADAVRPSIAP